MSAHQGRIDATAPMTHDARADSGGSDPLTTVVVSLLALAAVGDTVFCLIYAVWWLIAVCAPF